MKNRLFVVGAGSLALCAGFSLLSACGDDSVYASDAGASADAGPHDATVTDAFTPTPTVDAGTDGATVTPRLLVSFNGSTDSELVAFNLTTNAVDGRLKVPSFLGTTYVSGDAPYFLAQATDQVLKLDAKEPWKVVSSWNVAGPDKAPDGGYFDTSADPDVVAVAAGSKAYVLRFTREKIAVIDTSQVIDGGAPTKLIDLGGLVDPNDSDGVPEMSAAYYHAGRKRLYVLLGNIDRRRFDFNTNALICSGLHATLVAIDTTTDSLVSLGGAAPGGGIVLPGFNPPLGTKMVYDATNDRLLVLQAGCNANLDAGVAVGLQQRQVDEVRLATGVAKSVLDLNGQAFPNALALANDKTAIVGTFGGTYLWAIAGNTLGAVIPNTPDSFVVDQNGSLLGLTQTYLMDGGMGALNVVRVTQDGGSTTLGSDLQSYKSSFFVGGVDLWQ
jgi:hypothetical protein